MVNFNKVGVNLEWCGGKATEITFKIVLRKGSIQEDWNSKLVQRC